MFSALLVALAASVPTVDCRTHVETDPVPVELRRRALAQSLTARGTIFWGLRGAERGTFDGTPRTLTHKAAVSIRSGRPVTIKVAAVDRAWLALDYDHAGESGRPSRGDGEAITRFVRCPPGTKRFSDGRRLGPETAWAGGFIVSRAGCATLLVRRAGDKRWRELRAGFGVRCSP